MNGEGGDDIMVGSTGPGTSYLGASGFDWATYKDDKFGVNIDLTIASVQCNAGASVGGCSPSRFAEVEGLSGSAFGDILRGDDSDAAASPPQVRKAACSPISRSSTACRNSSAPA